MKRTIKPLTFALLLAFCACQKHQAPPPEEDALYQVECLYKTHRDSAAQILDTLDVSVLSEREKAHYCLLSLAVNNRFEHFDAEADSLLQVAENQFIGSGNEFYEAKTYRFLANKAKATGAGDHLLLENMLKALQSIEQCEHVDERLVRFAEAPTDEQGVIDALKFEIHDRLGVAYGRCSYWKEAHDHLKLAEQYYAERQDYKSQMTAATYLGHSYLGLAEYDSCLPCYQTALRCAETLNDTARCAYYHHNIAYYYLYLFDNQKPETDEGCRQLLRQSVSANRKALSVLDGKPSEDLPDIYEGLAAGYYWLNQYDSTIYFAQKLIETDSAGNPDNCLYRAYLHLYRSYQALGDHENASKYSDLYINSLDRNAKAEQKAIAEVQDDYKNQLEMQRLEDEQQLKRMQLYLWIAGLIIILLALVFLFYRHQKGKQLETLRLAEEKRQLQQDYDDKERISGEALRQRMQTVYLEQNDKLYDRILKEFKALYPNTLEEIAAAHPELTETELSICLLSFFSFRVKEIAYILDLKENTVSKNRLSIKKKTGLDEPAEVARPFIG